LPLAEFPAEPLRLAARIAATVAREGFDAVRISPAGDGMVELLSTDGFRLCRLLAEGSAVRSICLPSRLLVSLGMRHREAELISIAQHPDAGLAIRSFSASQTTVVVCAEVNDLLPLQAPEPSGQASKPLPIVPRLLALTLTACGATGAGVRLHVYGGAAGPLELQLSGDGWEGGILIAGAQVEG
jgi:hypothetical protein